MGQQGQMLSIVDQTLIAEVMAYLETRYKPQRVLAKKLGISQPTVSRLASAEGPPSGLIALRLFEAVRDLIADNPTFTQKWLRAIGLTPKGKEAAAMYVYWVENSRHMLRYCTGIPGIETQQSSEWRAKEEWRSARDQSFDKLREVFAQQIRDFREAVSGGKYDEHRIELAIDRALAPLLDYELSGGVERKLLMNTAPSRKAQLIVEVGLKREEFLLDRPGDRIAMYMAAGRRHRSTDANS